MGSVQLPKALDLSHHLSALSRARPTSSLKDTIKFMGYDGMVSLAGGLPHPSLFPFQRASIHAYPNSISLDAENIKEDVGKTEEVFLEKHSKAKDYTDLAKAMQYSSGTGDPALWAWAREFTQLVFQPGYADFKILLNLGNTDAWCKAVKLLCDPGDYILCEEYTFPSSQEVWIPMDCKAVPVAMDGEGLRADDLDQILAKWESTHPGTRRPRLMYIVPVGSNPVGSTMQGRRRSEIYDICVKYDVIICEDDPYYFLQYSPFVYGAAPVPKDSTPSDYLSTLSPSFLKYDTQGRVIRLDTFSKTIAPGCRLGYFVMNPIFWEKLLCATQVETQAPSGWSQAITYGLLQKWGTDGYVEWLATLRDQYQTRRNWMCDAIAKSFDVRPVEKTELKGAEGLAVYLKGSESKPVFTFAPPMGGMFVWARFYFAESPRFKELQGNTDIVDPENAFANELWERFAENLVLLSPGKPFNPWQGEDNAATKPNSESKIGHFRLAFSTSTKEQMELGIKRVAEVVSEFWP